MRQCQSWIFFFHIPTSVVYCGDLRAVGCCDEPAPSLANDAMAVRAVGQVELRLLCRARYSRCLLRGDRVEIERHFHPGVCSRWRMGLDVGF